MDDARSNAFLSASAVLAAFGASLCCIVPLAVAVLGVGSAALGAALVPLRPWFAGLTVILLGIAFWQAYRPAACAPGESCAVSPVRRRQRIALWIAAAVALALMALPYYVSWLF